MRTKLNNEERIILIAQKHWLPILFQPVICITVCGLLAFKIDYFKGYYFYLALNGICILVYKLLQRTNNRWIVTDFRVIEETGIFTQITLESSLDKINNVSYSQNIWGRLFGFGNISIQTAAQHGTAIYFNVKQPKLLKETISIMQVEYNKAARRQLTKSLENLVTNDILNNSEYVVGREIKKLYQLKEKGILTEEEYGSIKCKILYYDKNTQFL